MNERSFIVKSYFKRPWYFSQVPSAELPSSAPAEHGRQRWSLCRAAGTNPTPKHAAALYVTISYPIRVLRRDAIQPAQVALANPSRRKDPESVAR
jgi:hypothetical protein